MQGLLEWLGVRRREPDLPRLRELIGPGPGIRLLDVGGGTGAVTERCASGSEEIIVLEPDRKKVAAGRRRRPGIRFEEGRAESIPFPEGFFDRVVSVAAFHHVADQDRALQEMRRVLRDTGRIVLLELPPAQAPSRFVRWIGGYAHGGHLAFLEPAGLKAKLEAHGFRGVADLSGVRCYFVTGTK